MSRKNVTAIVAMLVATGSAPLSDEIALGWTPVELEGISGYRIEYGASEGGPLTHDDVPPELSAHTVSGLVGNCSVWCVRVRTLGPSGQAGAASAEICGIPDPEVFDVAAADGGWIVHGDNFAGDVQVAVDGDDVADFARQDCKTLYVGSASFDQIEIRNPSDDVGVIWSWPWSGAAEEDPASTVILRCQSAPGSALDTVTAVSHAPGLGLAIEADVPGVGTSCADAIALIRERTGKRRPPRTVRAGEGSIYVFE